MPRPQRSPQMSFSDPSTWEQMFQELIQEEKPRAKWTLQLDKNILPDDLTTGWRQYQQEGDGWIIEAIVATSPCWPPQCFIILIAILEAHVPGSSNDAWLNMLSKEPSFPSSTQIQHTLTHKPDLCVDKACSYCSQCHWLVRVPASSAPYEDSPLPASPFPLLGLWP
uniref:receptor-transporting protein 4 isoform X2 n=1 Tax=Myodes glareolus TaxID=447135 RepID=UPI0020204551|nr:receptor-transporting protein 4 isoform X2 [Myodes glareolus]